MKEKKHISLMIIMISLSLFSSYHIYYYFQNKNNSDLVKDYYINDTISEPDSKVERLNREEGKEEYLGILEIPKINLKKGFYSINSKNNNINKNITILKESKLPNMDGSIIYLVAHSGYGYLAYFRELNKLKINDIINIDINNIKYKYTVFDIYEMEKNGKIVINHNIKEKYLVLSTCSNNKQLVVISKLLNEDLY